MTSPQLPTFNLDSLTSAPAPKRESGRTATVSPYKAIVEAAAAAYAKDSTSGFKLPDPLKINPTDDEKVGAFERVRREIDRASKQCEPVLYVSVLPDPAGCDKGYARLWFTARTTPWRQRRTKEQMASANAPQAVEAPAAPAEDETATRRRRNAS